MASCFGSSVKHLKLVFNGQTHESFFNSKMWMEALQQFSKIESLSINVQSGLNFFYLFRFLSENKLVFNWLKTIRRLEVLDVAPKADPDLAIIDSLILNI
jgi:hypothetical protein